MDGNEHKIAFSVISLKIQLKFNPDSLKVSVLFSQSCQSLKNSTKLTSVHLSFNINEGLKVVAEALASLR